MPNQGERVPREVLPIPDQPPVAVPMYRAIDPDNQYPPIVPL
jgi:hypothetical protein